MLSHSIQRKRDKLRIVLDLELAQVQDALPLTAGTPFEVELQAYLQKVVFDIGDVARILLEQGETGTVKWFDANKGYGFIRSHDSKDVFVHHNGILGDGLKSLEQGQVVRFKRREGRLSTEAVDVELL